jgi:hypothetical protein
VTGAPQISGVSYDAGNGFSLSFPTLANFNYRVAYKDNLTDADWLTLTNFTATASSCTFTDPTTNTNSARFYRVTVIP